MYQGYYLTGRDVVLLNEHAGEVYEGKLKYFTNIEPYAIDRRVYTNDHTTTLVRNLCNEQINIILV